MDHVVFFLLHFLVFLFILVADRRHARDYLLVGLLALGLDLVFEILPLQFGIWSYTSAPFVAGISLYTWLLYLPYLAFCLFCTNQVVKHV